MGSKVIRNVTKILKATSGRLFGRVTSGTGRAEELTPSDVRTLLEVATTTEIASAYQPLGSYAAAIHTHSTSDVTGLDTALSGKQATLVSGTNIKTINSTSLLGSGDIAVGVTGTGGVDNAALRADGTGGATLQSSAWIIADNYTVSPNNTVNHASLQATGGTTNVSVSIVPKGTGAFCLAVPDGTATGGNARGANAIDLSSTRGEANQVASGERAVVLGAGTASGQNSTAIQGGTASGIGSVIFGVGTASGTSSFAAAMVSGIVSGTQAVGFCRDGGTQNGTRSFSHGEVPGYGSGNVTGQNAVAFSGAQATASTTFAAGYYAESRLYGMYSHASGSFSGVFGEVQRAAFVLRNKTTSAVATELFLDGSSARLTIPSGKILSALVRVVGVKSDGSEIIKFVRDVTIKNIGGTTSLETSPVTIGTDINVSAATLDLSADNANDSIKIAVTPPTGTWRWAAVVEVALEIAYGT